MTSLRLALAAIALGAALPLTATADDAAAGEAPETLADFSAGYMALGVNLPLRASPPEAAPPQNVMSTGAISTSRVPSPAAALRPTTYAAASHEDDTPIATARQPAAAALKQAVTIEPAPPVAAAPSVKVKEVPLDALGATRRAKSQQTAKAKRAARRDDATTASLIGRALDQPANDVFSATSKTKMAFYFGD